MIEPDYTIRRGEGLYEHEITNVFHLATLANKEVPKHKVDHIRKVEKELIASRLEAMLKEKLVNSSDRGWNAAIIAAIRTVFKNDDAKAQQRNDGSGRRTIEGGPSLRKPNWHSGWAYSERRDGLAMEAQEQSSAAEKRRGKRRSRR